MVVKILGGGCKNCKKLHMNAVLALDELGIKAEIVKVTDFQDISKYDVMRTPALVVDEVVLTQGDVPNKAKIMELLSKR